MKLAPVSERRAHTRHNTGGIARADLLRVLAAFDAAGAAIDSQISPEVAQTVAQTLDFHLNPPNTEPAEIAPTLDALMVSIAAEGSSAMAAPLASPLPAPRRPLRAPMLGIISVTSLSEPEAPPQAPQTPLRPEEYLPRNPGVAAFRPLMPDLKLARRLQAALVQYLPGRNLDLRHLVPQLACGALPPRWPTIAWAYPPEHLTVIIDRSLHLRPYWDDQDQLVYLAGQWLGAGNLTTLTIQGNPWQVLASWSGGQERTPPPCCLTPAPPAGCVVLVLSDMAPPSAHWVQALRHLGRHGARVLVSAPGSPGAAAMPPVNLSAQSAENNAANNAPLPDAALEQLLTLLACARRIEPELVRAMRRLSPALAADPGLEARCWACHSCLNVSWDVCVWRVDKALAYRKKFEALAPQMQEKVLQVMREIHSVRGRAIEVQEMLVWASHVSVDTAARHAEAIAAAADWLRRLPLATNIENAAQYHAQGQAELLAFVQQTVAFNGADASLIRNFYAIFGPLWGMAHLAAERNGQPAPDPGALPAEHLAHWRKPGVPQATRRYGLQQMNGQIVLKTGGHGSEYAGDYAWSPMGMALDLDWLAVTRQAGGSQFSYPSADLVPLGDSLPQQAMQLHTGRLALEVGEIRPPFPAAEQGRDQYGLYADMLISVGKAVQRQRMRYIEPGRFLMGSPETELGRYDDEGPQHQVTITHGFWLAETACTQALWQAVMVENPSYFHAKNKGGPQHPVENVSWDMIQVFLGQLEKLVPGCNPTLPTEAEWEYACRAGSTGAFHFGAEINTELVNYSGKFWYEDEKGMGEYRERTMPVDEFSPNAWGLYQMHGNVWEWCYDGNREYAAEALENPGLDGLLAGAARALRGGSWGSGAQGARSACRGAGEPGGRDDIIGFRLACRSASPVLAEP